MNQATEEMLSQSAEDVLAALAFAFVMPGEEEPVCDKIAKVFIRFSGPFSGTLYVTVPCEIVPQLAQNMLGLEDGECTESMQHDALRELLNVICGNLLPRLAGPEPVFDLSTPDVSIEDCSVEQDQKDDPDVKVRLPLEEGWIEIALVTDRENA